MTPEPVLVRIGPAGSGKTHRAAARCSPTQWLVVPSESAVKRLSKQVPSGGVIRTFRSLAERIVSDLGSSVVSPAMRAHLLRQAVRTSVAPDSYFAAAAPRPGFGPAIGDLIRELKQALVTPDAFRRTAAAAAPSVDDPCFLERCEAVIAVWDAYEALLRRHKSLDAEDLLRHAAEAAPRWRARPEAVVVDGFTAFTLQQLVLLGALRDSGVALEICLTGEASREVLFARMRGTLESVRRHLGPVEERWETQRGRHITADSLRHLERHLFGSGLIQPCDGSVCVFEAPDPFMEAEMVVRAICRLIEGGVPAGRIAVVQRSLDASAGLLKSTFARYGVPMSLHAGQPLAENPLVSLLMALLRVFLDDWPRAEVVRCAKSSYFALPPEEADFLERRAIARGTRQGRDHWLGLLRRAEHGETAVYRWLHHLDAWQQRLSRTTTPRGFQTAFRQMVAAFGLLDRAREAEQLLTKEDEAAWQVAQGLLKEMARAETAASEGPFGPAAFTRALLAGWEGAVFSVEPSGDGVAVLEAFDARQRPFDAVFLMGLSERLFPNTPDDNPFLRDDERKALASFGVELPRLVDIADEERLLLYRVVTAPSVRLIVSFPHTSADGRPALPSYYLEEILGVFDPGSVPVTARTAADVVPDLGEAVGRREEALCAAAALAGHKALPPADLEALLDRLSASAPGLGGDARRSLRPQTQYGLRSPRLKRQFARAARRAFSPSELEVFLSCPYRHFLAYQLRIREVSEEPGALEMGTLLHAVLREFFTECRSPDAGAQLPEDAEERIADVLDQCLERTIREPRPWRLAMIRHAALQYLERFLERERAYRAQTGLVPAYLELGFGPQAHYQQEFLDGRSCPEPLVVPGMDGDVAIAGRMDRVDLAPDGQGAVVIDYKLSSVPSFQKMREGESLQAAIYLRAMERLFGKRAAAVIFHPLRRGDPFWVHRLGVVEGLRPTGRGQGLSANQYDELQEQAQRAIAAAAAGIRDGETTPRPDPKGHCSFCPFGDICRPEEGEGHQDA